MPYIGVDYHKKFSYVTVIDKEGKCLREGRVGNSKEDLDKFLGGYKEEGHGVMEATRNWTVMHDWLEEMLEDVVLAHPMKVKWIAEAKVKTDKIDANVLAQLLRCDLLPEAYVPGKEAREVKNILRQRMFLIRIKTMVKNRIHTILDRHPEINEEKSALGTDLFGKSGMKWMKGIALQGADQDLLEREIELLEDIGAKLEESNGLVKRYGRKDERVKRVKTIPGMGDFFSLLLVNEIDDIKRFRDAKKLAAYAGLVPSTYSSGGKTFHGHITKQGNKWIRWAMVEAVWPAVRSDEELKKMYEEIKSRKGANLAKVAVAKRLLTIVFRVLSQNRNYEERPYNKSSRLPSYFAGCYSNN
jgi:transposase